MWSRFLSTPSARRATPKSSMLTHCHLHFYPRPPRGGRRAYGLIYNEWFRFLSTPSARRATHGMDGAERHRDISIHALREEGDWPSIGTVPPEEAFLSTPSARRATVTRAIKEQWPTYFYPRPPRGGRRLCRLRRRPTMSISIHALREEGDTPTRIPASTHTYFYPRPPRGGRLGRTTSIETLEKFLSTPSARRATAFVIFVITPFGIFLSTPSARRATHRRGRPASSRSDFYPRPPRGGRRRHRPACRLQYDFYPRPPRGGRPGLPRRHGRHPEISIHALREEGDP